MNVFLTFLQYIIAETRPQTVVYDSKDLLDVQYNYDVWQWRRKLWGTGARAPLDF